MNNKQEIIKLTRHRAAFDAKQQSLKLNNPLLSNHYVKLINDIDVLINYYKSQIAKNELSIIKSILN